MRFPLSWLRDWIELPAELQQITDLLVKVGVGLEAVEDPSIHLKNVVVARVLKREAHPQADKLSLCQVSDGSQTLQIVCGAKNFKEGDLVPLAKEGAVLPGDFKIKRSKIRNVESFGMLCSSEELGLGKGEDGLLVLDPSLAPGLPLAQALGLGDPILTLETTANRPDHLSLRGLAREISALTGKPLKVPKLDYKSGGSASGLSASIEDSEACSLYSGAVVRGLKVAPSPAWLRSRVEGAGIRSINNVVDVTNAILIEYGQPMHAFDLSKIEGGQIRVRAAQAGETLVTLDGQERKLEAGDLVIADAKKALALGGVMGGQASQVKDATVDILLEAAVFKPILIRRTSRRLNLRSESSLRFERGVDAASTAEALKRALVLMTELAGGQASAEILKAGPGAPAPAKMEASIGRLNALLGSAFSPQEAASLLTRRGFQVQAQGEILKVMAPSWRPDIGIEADLAEELAHVAGMDSLPSTQLPEVRTPDDDDKEWRNASLIKDALKGLGLREATSLSYLDPALAKHWGMNEKALNLNNPWSEEQSLLRPSLLPNLVGCAAESLKRQAESAALFELGHVFEKAGKGEKEAAHLAMVLAGQAVQAQWTAKPREADFYDLRGFAEGLALALRSSLRVSPEKDAPAYLHPVQSAKIFIGALNGWMGTLHPALAKDLGIKRTVLVLEMGGWAQQELLGIPRYKDFSRLPFVERDLSCLVDEGFQAGQLIETLKKEGGFQASQLRLKDVYQGGSLPQGKKSLTVSLIYKALENTLTDEEVNRKHEALCQALKSKLPLEIRA
jgi:phenylalanyl-tRNA synthetase beta chain